MADIFDDEENDTLEPAEVRELAACCSLLVTSMQGLC
jgi:hypothetical protein